MTAGGPEGTHTQCACMSDTASCTVLYGYHHSSSISFEGDHSLSSSPVLRGRPPPRLFCDICDVFDQHDTDDCPLQAGELDELAIHSAYHADRQAERPYCDTCEGDCASGAWVWV